MSAPVAAPSMTLDQWFDQLSEEQRGELEEASEIGELPMSYVSQLHRLVGVLPNDLISRYPHQGRRVHDVPENLLTLIHRWRAHRPR